MLEELTGITFEEYTAACREERRLQTLHGWKQRLAGKCEGRGSVNPDAELSDYDGPRYFFYSGDDGATDGIN